jgi:YARHG domain
MLKTMTQKLVLAVVFLATLTSGQRAMAQASAGKGNDGERPFYYTRQITDDDLIGRSLRELTLMRNTIYARAGNKFRKQWLNDYFSAQPWYHPLDKMDQSKITPLDRKNAEIIAKYDADIPRDELLAMQQSLLNPQRPEDKIDLRLVSMRLGKWAGSADQDRTPLEDPTLLDKQITMAGLKDFSRRDLRLLRNLIYARRGRPFKSDLLKGYFAAVDWYKPDPAYTDARLNLLDRRNINVILSLENQLGGPLTDWEHKREDGWFAQA